MKIAAFSDTHGCLGTPYTLPYIIGDVDVIAIAGDIIPLDYQRDYEHSMMWFKNCFLPWTKEQTAEKIIFIGGNHDKYFEQNPNEVREIINKNDLSDKVIYLFDETYEYCGKIFYGTPWVEKLKNWSFYTSMPYETFSKIPECDILISHTPPRVDKVGCSYPNTSYEKNYGSTALLSILEQRETIPIIICGHIHTGIHDGVKHGNKTIFNVSMIDEDYKMAYEPTYIEIDNETGK